MALKENEIGRRAELHDAICVDGGGDFVDDGGNEDCDGQVRLDEAFIVARYPKL